MRQELRVQDLVGEHGTCLACQDGYKRLFAVISIGEPSSLRYEVRVKDKVLHSGQGLAEAIDTYNKADQS